MKINASAKLNTPRVTGCTCGAAPRRVDAELVQQRQDEEEIRGLGDDLV